MNYYSFDVFDTCLCRLCGEPRLLFDVLSIKLQQLMGASCTEHMRQLFVATRINSPGKNLTEIYTHVSEHYSLPCTIEQMVEMELATEKEMLVPIVATKELVNTLRTKGDILFISDMYLPSSFIQERLIEHGFFQKGDRLFVSDELGAWKNDGSLYKLIHNTEGISYQRWHHYGDNHHSDYRTPCKLGIHAHHLHYDYLPYEEQWRQKPVLQFQYPSILAGVARAVRLSSNAPDDQKAFVCNISAPLMVSWILNILTDAKKRGIKKIYFCARDMHSQYHMALALHSLFPNIEFKYLFISGPALYNSQKCIDYLRQEGLCDNTPSAIVDSCSSGKTIQVMNQLLTQNGHHSIYGYFWAKMAIEGAPHVDDYFELDSDYLSSITNGRVKRLLGMRIIYELLISINYHKKTYGYEKRHDMIRPVFCEDNDDSFMLNNDKTPQENKKNNDSLLVAFTTGFINTSLQSFHNEVLHYIALPQLIDYSNYPHKQYLNYLHQFLWWGKPFVGAFRGKNKGVWKRGNLFYNLPGFITTPLRAILSDDKTRRRLNRMLTWIKHS